MKLDFLRVVNAAQFFISQRIKKGSIVVDATCGNGNDTLFLSNLVENGTVYAIDIQSEAIKRSRKLLARESKFNNVVFINDDHKNIKNLIPTDVQGKISAVMYNLGYLPNSDHQILTNSESTIESIKEAQNFLAPNGIITVCVYPHDIGKNEGINLEKYLKNLTGEFNSFKFERLNRNNPPYLIIITRDK